MSPDDTVLLFEDEFSLSNTATIGYAWSKIGFQPMVQAKQRGRERMTGMGSYNYLTGQITVSFHAKGNYKTFKKHLKKVLEEYKGHSKITMVDDNVRFHHAIKLKSWLQTKPKLELMYLPPYSLDLNILWREHGGI